MSKEKNVKVNLNLTKEHLDYIEEMREKCNSSGSNLSRSAVIRAIISAAKESEHENLLKTLKTAPSDNACK